MSLESLLNSYSENQKQNQEKTLKFEERVNVIIPIARRYISFWREYPDIFAEFLCKDNPENFSFYFYQRVTLRAFMRHRYAYATFTRSYSKSFLAVLTLVLRCILYPNSHLFITTQGKDQAASIAKEKITELMKLIPGIKDELRLDRGQTKTSKDDFELIFKNGSRLDIFAATARTRGQRSTGGLVDEVILVDQTILNEVIIPTMAVDRRIPDGTYKKEETVNKSQIYITSAGWKNSFAKTNGKFVGEVKPREPQNEGVYNSMLTLKAYKNVTVCQAA